MSSADERFWKNAEINRAAHELTARHGERACAYAEQLQRKAEADGQKEDAEFWGRVAMCMKIREAEGDP